MPQDINILVIGKTKHSYIQVGIQDYLTRLKHYANVEIVEIRKRRNATKLSSQEIMKQEGELIANHLEASDYLIALDRCGKMLDSVEIARELKKRIELSSKRIAFLIGGELGLASKLIDRADEVWSFSKMTFPHDIMRLILVEQLYRAFTILAGEKYHK